ncbi:3-methyl-2-oxobutanoate hydroxymethyltransferase [Brevifollis gellanilyticus]|uniref:3-methyl-2-oxobutanoate hydroxymethyltransferase n=1 Tax=Brevifollis gellanilyticus TaxID=748831 RepID=UPI0011BD60A6|nr:3-methyl-2-oxobutanoate hydroxymethyltransferase [Brevifollis gellanilyticus]
MKLAPWPGVLESVVADVAAEITRCVNRSTIGIGACPGTDGQVLVTPDLVGGFPWFRPPFAKARADITAEITRATGGYVVDCRC